MVSGALLGIKWTVCEADHSPPSSVDVEAVPPFTYVIMARCLIKHRYNCISQLSSEYKQKYLPNCLKILNERLLPTLQSKVIFEMLADAWLVQRFLPLMGPRDLDDLLMLNIHKPSAMGICLLFFKI
jgi:hypothetical protein